jgi:hypothetical protein
MGKKRGFHIVNIRGKRLWVGYYAIDFKRSKCRYAKTYTTYVRAKDELDAYMQVKLGASK